MTLKPFHAYSILFPCQSVSEEESKDLEQDRAPWTLNLYSIHGGAPLCQESARRGQPHKPTASRYDSFGCQNKGTPFLASAKLDHGQTWSLTGLAGPSFELHYCPRPIQPLLSAMSALCHRLPFHLCPLSSIPVRDHSSRPFSNWVWPSAC